MTFLNPICCSRVIFVPQTFLLVHVNVRNVKNCASRPCLRAQLVYGCEFKFWTFMMIKSKYRSSITFSDSTSSFCSHDPGQSFFTFALISRVIIFMAKIGWTERFTWAAIFKSLENCLPTRTEVSSPWCKIEDKMGSRERRRKILNFGHVWFDFYSHSKQEKRIFSVSRKKELGMFLIKSDFRRFSM